MTVDRYVLPASERFPPVPAAGGPARPVGSVALRPRLTTGLPFLRCKVRLAVSLSALERNPLRLRHWAVRRENYLLD